MPNIEDDNVDLEPYFLRPWKGRMPVVRPVPRVRAFPPMRRPVPPAPEAPRVPREYLYPTDDGSSHEQQSINVLGENLGRAYAQYTEHDSVSKEESAERRSKLAHAVVLALREGSTQEAVNAVIALLASQESADVYVLEKLYDHLNYHEHVRSTPR